MPGIARIPVCLALAVACALAAPMSLADDRDTIIASCGAKLNLSAGGCDCIADKAVDEFNENEFAFFLAVIAADKAAQAIAQGKLSIAEQTHVGSRMMQMPAECAG